MKAVFIDSSKEWIAIVVGQEAIVKILNSQIRKKFGRTVHMRELKASEKFAVLRFFNHLFSKKRVRLYSLKYGTGSWWTELVRGLIKKRMSVLYVDSEIYQELKRRVHPAYLKSLNIYLSKKDTQCADILAYGDSHHKLVRNIWKQLEIIRGGS